MDKAIKESLVNLLDRLDACSLDKKPQDDMKRLCLAREAFEVAVRSHYGEVMDNLTEIEFFCSRLRENELV